MPEWLNQTRLTAQLLQERVGLHPLGLLGSVVLLVLVGGWWFWPQGPAENQTLLGDAAQRIVCQACDYDGSHTLSELRSWKRDESGWYACPKCQASRADRYRVGGVRVITPRPATESQTPPSDD